MEFGVTDWGGWILGKGGTSTWYNAPSPFPPEEQEGISVAWRSVALSGDLQAPPTGWHPYMYLGSQNQTSH